MLADGIGCCIRMVVGREAPSSLRMIIFVGQFWSTSPDPLLSNLPTGIARVLDITVEVSANRGCREQTVIDTLRHTRVVVFPAALEAHAKGLRILLVADCLDVGGAYTNVVHFSPSSSTDLAKSRIAIHSFSSEVDFLSCSQAAATA